MRCRLLWSSVVVLVALLAAFIVSASAASTDASAAPSVSAFFLRGEQLAPTRRVASTPADAMRELLAGPTGAERQRAFRKYIPAGTALHGVVVANGLATIDLSAAFVSGGDSANLLARLSQVVRTLTGLDSVNRVQLLIDGKKISGVFPRIPTDGPITFALLGGPTCPRQDRRREG